MKITQFQPCFLFLRTLVLLRATDEVVCCPYLPFALLLYHQWYRSYHLEFTRYSLAKPRTDGIRCKLDHLAIRQNKSDREHAAVVLSHAISNSRICGTKDLTSGL